MNSRIRKNRKNLYLWIIATILAAGLVTGYYNGRADSDTAEASEEVKY